MRRMLLSALALAIVCLALVLYRPERRRQLLSMALLFAVIGAEMVCSIAMGVAKVSLTSRSSYPRESEDVQAVLQAVPEGSGRVEVTSYQTLNDAALNGYRGHFHLHLVGKRPLQPLQPFARSGLVAREQPLPLL